MKIITNVLMASCRNLNVASRNRNRIEQTEWEFYAKLS